MIISFKSKETKDFFQTGKTKSFENIRKVALRKLDMLNSAKNFNDLRVPPANRLEALQGNRQGQYSIRINDQYRICFLWIDNNAENVEIVDYH